MTNGRGERRLIDALIKPPTLAFALAATIGVLIAASILILLVAT